MAASSPTNVCLPMQVHAFVLNEAVADGPQAKIAPITQPNYTFLRLSQQIIQSDIHDHVDLHYTSPHQNNSRVTDLGTGLTLNQRLGVYISWVIPRAYRSGTAATTSSGVESRKQQQGFPTGTAGTPDYSAPDFRPVPTRWLVVRHIDTDSIVPAVTQTVAQQVQCRAWVIESDRQWSLDDDALRGKDLQVDYSPFVAPSRNNDMSSVEQQAEVFIGNKTDAVAWTEDTGTNPPKRIAPLSLLSSSNHLFADYQPHNTNVFSMLDDFKYTDDAGKDQIMQYAKASYYVMGWHSGPTDDPFYIKSQVTTQRLRLDALNMVVQGSGDGNGPVNSWLGSEDPSRSLCHGTVYDVLWDAAHAPTVVAAREAAQQLTQNKPKIPVAVGATAMDALVTYVSAHKDSDTGIVGQLEKDLWNIRTLLLAQEDGADPRLEAKDVLFNLGFERSDGGIAWHRSGGGAGGGGDGVLPSAAQIPNLALLDQTQAALDIAKRTAQALQWELFALWWKFVSGAFGDPTDPKKTARVKNELVLPLVKRINTLLGLKSGASAPPVNSIPWLQSEVTRLTNPSGVNLPVEAGSAPPFFTPKDPTLMVGGVAPGWTGDYLDKLAVRLDFQVPNYQDNPDVLWSEFDTPNGANGLVQKVVKKLPSGLQPTAISLLREFKSLRTSVVAKPPSTGCYLPLYHDQGPVNPDPNAPPPLATDPWRDRWNGQPWFPLFVEWEAEYFHIPFGDFEPIETQEEDSVSIYPVLRYQIRKGVQLMGNVPDRRTVSGRILLLPQPNFSLKAAIQQLKRNMGPLLAEYIPASELAVLLRDIAELPYLSHPLTGLRDHLVTRVQGTHIKTTQRPPGEVLTVMKAASAASAAISIGDDEIMLQGSQSDLTPYGHSVGAVAYPESKAFPPLKPVTHGQMRLTALNIIDKFGQAICALDPTPVTAANLPHVAPALADRYACQELSPGVPNVVDGGLTPPFCEFIQLPPGINQAARLNAAFVTLDAQDSTWRPVKEWENPLWGWIVVNYVESSLQLFLPDGTFYREVVHGGFQRDTVSPAWAPFQRPDIKPTEAEHQLDFLVHQLANEAYLVAFFDMLNGAFACLPAAPDSYAQYMSSIIGRPLALTNVGWGIELAVPPMQNESTINKTPEDCFLLSPSTPVLPTGNDPPSPLPPSTTPQYPFRLKMGDGERAYDGMIGYFETATSSTSLPTSIPGSGFDYSIIYTYFPSDKSPSATTMISTANYPHLSATYVYPDSLTNPKDTNGGTQLKSPAAISSERNAALNLFSCIVDPFTPIHGYTGILPIQTLKVPPWAMESAMNKMTAFFKVGPVMLPTDVPVWDLKQVLTASDAPDKVFVDGVTGIKPMVGVPSVGKAGWAWLQPYDEVVGGRGNAADNETVPPPPYMAVGVGTVDSRPRFEDAPYTVVEGYLRQTGPLMNPGKGKA